MNQPHNNFPEPDDSGILPLLVKAIIYFIIIFAFAGVGFFICIFLTLYNVFTWDSAYVYLIIGSTALIGIIIAEFQRRRDDLINTGSSLSRTPDVDAFMEEQRKKYPNKYN